MPQPPGHHEPRIYAIYGTNPTVMAKEMLDQADVAASVPSGARISLKPNLVVSRPAAGGATTHPEIVAGIIEYFRDHGCHDIEIIESAWVGDDTARAFANCGYVDLAKKYGVVLHDLKADSSTPVPTPAGTIRICDRALAADFLVNVPVLKGHCQTRMTCALKNMKGCIPDTEKRRFHRDGLDQCIAALAAVLKPHLTLVDGICGDVDFEEGGNPVTANRMFLARDSVAMDAYGATLMGIPPAEVGYIGLAEKYGAGTMNVAAGDIVELNHPAPGTPSGASGMVAQLVRDVRADGACSACYANLVHALKRSGRRRRAQGPIHIGQGWRNARPSGIGIGDCCRGVVGTCVPGCPPTALAIVAAISE